MIVKVNQEQLFEVQGHGLTLSKYVKKFNSTKLSSATCLNMILLGNYHKGICFYGALKDKLWHKQSENVHGTFLSLKICKLIYLMVEKSKTLKKQIEIKCNKKICFHSTVEY